MAHKLFRGKRHFLHLYTKTITEVYTHSPRRIASLAPAPGSSVVNCHYIVSVMWESLSMNSIILPATIIPNPRLSAGRAKIPPPIRGTP